MNNSRFFRFRTPTSVLIIANIVAIIFAVVQKWDVAAVLCLYLAESFIIMGFNCVRVLSLRQFTAAKKWGTIILIISLNAFIFPIVIICLVGAAILAKPYYDSASFAGFNLCIMIFIANHAFSCRYNIRRDRLTTPNIRKIVAIPFLRIIVIFLTVWLGIYLFALIGKQAGIFILVLFLIIKTIVDVKIHNWGNNIGQDEKQTGSL
jgi:hypothetical protein